MPGRALIVGLGLIGGAAGMALRGRGWRVAYADPHVDEHDARAVGAADGRGTVEDGDHDLIILATPVDVAVEWLAGAGLATFLRLAGSDASVWAPILAANRDNIRAHFDRVVAIARSLIEDDPVEAFRRANEVHARLVDR